MRMNLLPSNRHFALLLVSILGISLGIAQRSQAQVAAWHIGKGGLDWNSQAETQIGVLDVRGGLQPVELVPGENLVDLLAASGQHFLTGQPADFTVGGQPRAWSNDGLFNQIGGPFKLLDGDPETSSEGVFKTSQSQAGAAFFWDLGAPFPVDRIRFFPDPDDPYAFIKSFELRLNDGEDFNNINRPEYTLLRRVEVNKETVVDIQFAPLQVRFLQLLVLSKGAFNLAEFEIYGQGFVPVASYESSLHSFGGEVNFGRLRIHATRLRRGAATEEDAAPTASIQLRTGSDDTPLAYFRRDRESGAQQEVSAAEYSGNLPRRALFRQDPLTGQVLEEMAGRVEYLDLPVQEQGPVRDFVKGDVRDDVDHWSSWSPPIVMDSTGTIDVPIGLPSPREFMQFRVLFDGDANNAMRIDTMQVEFSPGLVSEAVGEMALAADPSPRNSVLEVQGGIDTTFIYDIRTEFGRQDLAGYRGLRFGAFPPPVFEKLEMGDPLVEVTDATVEANSGGFDVSFSPVTAENNQPLRVTFRLRLLEQNTPVHAWLLGAGDVPPHPIAAGNASQEVGTGAINAYATQSKPGFDVAFAPEVITPNGDGINDVTSISLVLSQFSAEISAQVELFDLGGRRVRRLFSGLRSAGAYTDVWDGCDDNGLLVPPGVYICRISVEADAAEFAEVQVIGVAY